MTNTTRAASMMERMGGVSNFSGYEKSGLTAIHEAVATPQQIDEATRYNVDGETLTKSQMLKKAVAKSIDFMGGKDKPTFHAIMKKTSDDQAEVFTITRREFDRLKVDDETTDRAKEKFVKFEIGRLSKDMTMSDKIDFNTWVKSQRREPSAEDKLAYLKQKFEAVSGTDQTADEVNEARGAKKLKLSFGEIAGINGKAKRGELPTGAVTKKNYEQIERVLKGRSKFGGITDEATAIKNNKATFYGDKATKTADFLGPYLRVTVKGMSSTKTTVEYYELPSDESLSERMVDSKKVNRDELQTSVANTLSALEAAGFKVKFDADTGEGELMYKGLTVGFEAGGENLNLDLPRMYTKEAPKETAEALADVLNVISNFGGATR